MSIRTIRRGEGLDAIVNRLERVTEFVANSGFPANGKIAAPKRTGSGHKPWKSMSEIASVATILDLGTEDGKIPPRPFFINVTREHLDALRKTSRRIMRKVVRGKADEEVLLEMGDALIRVIIKNIIDSNFAPNAPSTEKAKGFNYPIIDTGVMINSLQTVVERD